MGIIVIVLNKLKEEVSFFFVSINTLATASGRLLGYILDWDAQATFFWANHLHSLFFGFLKFCITFWVSNMG